MINCLPYQPLIKVNAKLTYSAFISGAPLMHDRLAQILVWNYVQYAAS